MKQAINIVWLKRDLRTQDHASFAAAEKESLPYLIIFLFEPEMISYKDTSLRHLRFQYLSIKDMNKTLLASNKKVEILYGDAVEVFDYLCNGFSVNKVFSYQESGTLITYNRDILVAELFKKYGCEWIEFQRDGIKRAIKNRDGWDVSWKEVMHAPLIKNEFTNTKQSNWDILSDNEKNRQVLWLENEYYAKKISYEEEDVTAMDEPMIREISEVVNRRRQGRIVPMVAPRLDDDGPMQAG
jgi:deoxyribodipyrimidine photo-lyase